MASSTRPAGASWSARSSTTTRRPSFEAQGYPAVKTLQTQADVDACAPSARPRSRPRPPPRRALTSSDAAKTKKATAGTVRAQRADYWEDVSGRYLSIEGTTTEARRHPAARRYTGPPLQAAWFAADGTQLGTGQLSAASTPTSAAAYLYHGTRFRVGNVGDGGMPAYVRIAAPNGDVATLDVKKWVGNGGTTSPGGFIQDFNTHYVTPRESYAKMRELAGNEFPNISKLMKLPNKTNGYQRKAQTVIGMARRTTRHSSSVGTRRPGRPAPQAVVLTSMAWGQEGGNNLTAAIVNDGASKAPRGHGRRQRDHRPRRDRRRRRDHQHGRAGRRRDQRQPTPPSARRRPPCTAPTRGAGVVSGDRRRPSLSDCLKAPTSQPRGPIEVQGLRIGNDVGKPQGSKVGVFIYCQEHAREWGTPLVCLETAERLVRNYGSDPETTALIDGLDIFIIPSINADGATYSMFDFNSPAPQHGQLLRVEPDGQQRPGGRNSWGVDLNRNFSVGSFFDGYVGASTTTAPATRSPARSSSPSPRPATRQYIQTTYPNIKFAMNVHSSGGYFMWPPGAYKADRTTLPYPPYGTLNYFDQTASSVLERIYSYRKTAILPAQTGPVTDVLYSAAGNSADEAYYNHGIIGYDFEIGATKRLADGTTASPGFQPPFGAVPIGGNANLANEGHDEGMEFSNGNYALLQSALDYANDTTAPSSAATGATLSNAPVGVKFTTNEAASIYYTTDGSTPTTASTEWKPNRPRELPDPVEIGANTTLKWIAVDFKGNTSAVQSKTYVVDLVKPTVAFTNPAADGATFTQGRPVPLIVQLRRRELRRRELRRLAGARHEPRHVDARHVHLLGDRARTTPATRTSVTRSYTVIQATNVDGGVNGSVPATLSLVLGTPATFGTFTPGVTKDYTAVHHGDRDLDGRRRDADASPTRARTTPATWSTARSSWPQPLQGLGTIKTWTAPTANESVPITFKQTIGATEGLRTGAYGKALTFTLSTTTP